MIKVSPAVFDTHGLTLPWQVFAEPAFPFRPTPFTAGGTKYLKTKLIQPSVQADSLASYLSNPQIPCVYAVGSEPADNRAKLFAAFLLQHYCTRVNGRPAWINLADRSDPIRDGASYTAMVISSVTPEVTPYRLEKLRDLIEHFHNIPRFVVVGGVDPVTFFAERLHLKATHLFFHSSTQIVRADEII